MIDGESKDGVWWTYYRDVNNE